MVFLESIIAGVVASLFASAVFLLWTRGLTPKIEICEKVSVYPNDNGDGRDTYRVKIMNERYRSVSDLSVRVLVMHLRQVEGGPIKVRKDIATRFQDVALPRRKRKDSEHDECARIRIDADELEEIFTNRPDPVIIVEVYCRDSWSGVGRVFRREFALGLDGFVHGSFKKGHTCEIAPYNGTKDMRLKQLMRDNAAGVQDAPGGHGLTAVEPAPQLQALPPAAGD